LRERFLGLRREKTHQKTREVIITKKGGEKIKTTIHAKQREIKQGEKRKKGEEKKKGKGGGDNDGYNLTGDWLTQRNDLTESEEKTY